MHKIPVSFEYFITLNLHRKCLSKPENVSNLDREGVMKTRMKLVSPIICLHFRGLQPGLQNVLETKYCLLFQRKLLTLAVWMNMWT